jgi:exopolyphosphatase/guanosine-5'-triphosphate,3'-diphosphate pyrophosphatase
MKNSDSYAIIDLGSNSFHMMIVQVIADSVQVIGRVKRKVRLASGLDKNNVLSEEAMQRGWECLNLFAERLQDIPSKNLRIAGTATLRLAVNVETFLTKAEAILGNKINVISGLEEANTIYQGVAYTSSNKTRRLVVDIGGASTELVAGDGDTPKVSNSLNVGCVTYLENYFPDGQLSEDNFMNAIAAAEQEISKVRDLYKDFAWQEEVGASGTVQAIQEILMHQGFDEVINLGRLVSIMQQAITYGSIDKLSIPGLAQERKLVFPSGVAILIAIFRQLNLVGMTLAGGALREGLLYSMLPELTQQNVRERTVKSVMTRYHVDVAHAQRVADLCVEMAEQLSDSWNMDMFEAKDILRSAGLLHEVGLQVAYKDQQQHASYILANTNLPGFTSAQNKLLVALVGSHKDDIAQVELSKQSSTSVLLACRLVRILRLAVILSLRRADEVMPKVKMSVEGESLLLTLPENWIEGNPLTEAELKQESQLQAEHGWTLKIK